jgi:outer membrane protein assembly factor BamB
MRVYGTAASLNNQVFFGCFNGKLYGVNSQTGTTETEFQTQESRSHYSQIYKADDTFRDDFVLYGDDILKSEQQILSLGSILSSILVDHQTLYFGDTNGHFYAIKIK